MKTAQIKVTGMHCSSCEMLITDSLKEIPGVQNATASHKEGTVSVTFDEHKASEQTIKNVIAKEGYKVK